MRIAVRYLLALLPLLVGATLAYAFNETELENPRLYLRFALSSFLLIVGAAISAMLLLGQFSRWYVLRRETQLTKQLQTHAATDRRRFLQRLDHELKNPLTAIRVVLANVQSQIEDAESLATIETQTVRLSRLTADLRKLADLETRPLELSDVDLDALLREVFETVEALPAAAERTLRLNIPAAPWPLPTIRGDWDLLFLAVYNLVNNAVKFTQAGDTIELRSAENSTHVTIEVADTGPGIPDDEQPHVWSELYRGESARGVPGSGLGLALVRAIIERHNGETALRSRSGQGTVVTLTLPLNRNS